MASEKDLSKEDYDAKQKEVEAVANPIIKRAYESANSGGGGSNMDDDDFLGEDVDGAGPSVEEVD